MSEIETKKETSDRRFEIVCGVVLTFLAAMLAITDLVGGRFGGDQTIAESEKANAYTWYDTKSIKQSLAEGQRDMLQALVSAGSIESNQVSTVTGFLEGLEGKVQKYNREKTEILEGSSVVGEANWVQDVDGEMGKVIGAKQWEAIVNKLEAAGNVIDMSILFLQLSLVMGAIALVFQHAAPRKLFFAGMILLGTIGICVSAYGCWMGFQAG